MLKYDSIAELVNEAEKRGLKLSELVLKTQAAMTEKTEEEMFATMEQSLQVMKESVQDGLDKDKRSASGLTGGDAYKLNEALKAGKNIAGHFFGNAMMKAVAVAQTNACMGRIVASPTAGSCGILPSALLTLQEEKNISDKDLVMALFTASAVGIVIATNASVAGAAGGCQAECGAASAMAAAFSSISSGLETETLWSYHTPFLPMRATSNSVSKAGTGMSKPLTSSDRPSG